MMDDDDYEDENVSSIFVHLLSYTISLVSGCPVVLHVNVVVSVSLAALNNVLPISAETQGRLDDTPNAMYSSQKLLLKMDWYSPKHVEHLTENKV